MNLKVSSAFCFINDFIPKSKSAERVLESFNYYLNPFLRIMGITGSFTIHLSFIIFSSSSGLLTNFTKAMPLAAESGLKSGNQCITMNKRH